VDGGIRVVRAQDTQHADRARYLLRACPAMIDVLDGIDGIAITILRPPTTTTTTTKETP
jgi:hypothetical protein